MVFTLKSPAKGYKTVMFLVIPPLIGLSPLTRSTTARSARGAEGKQL